MKKPWEWISSVIIVFIFFSTGCLSWEEGWKLSPAGAAGGDAKGLLAKANAQLSAADSKEKVESLVQTYEKVLAADPWNYEALWSLGRYNVLLATGYTDSTQEKKGLLLKALRYCERGMYTNKDFKKLVDAGMPVWDASSALTRREIAAMYYWYGAIGFYYRECMNPMVQVINLQWGGRNKKMLERMIEIDPTWGGGHPLYAKAAYYAVVPFLIGGDMKKADDYFARAEKAGPAWLYIRFYRAVLLHKKTGDREAYRKDLEWVVAQDPRKALSPYPWNVYFQREARRLLAENR